MQQGLKKGFNFISLKNLTSPHLYVIKRLLLNIECWESKNIAALRTEKE